MTDIYSYNQNQRPDDQVICDKLVQVINLGLPEAESKVWHAHPVWFLDGNPIVGYSKQKAGIRLMFWSGASFDEPILQPGTGKYQDASIFYTNASQIITTDIQRWLSKSRDIQWDYKNIVKHKGRLDRLK